MAIYEDALPRSQYLHSVSSFTSLQKGGHASLTVLKSYFVPFLRAKYREKLVKTTCVVKQMLEMEVEFLKIGNYTPI